MCLVTGEEKNYYYHSKFQNRYPGVLQGYNSGKYSETIFSLVRTFSTEKTNKPKHRLWLQINELQIVLIHPKTKQRSTVTRVNFCMQGMIEGDDNLRPVLCIKICYSISTIKDISENGKWDGGGRTDRLPWCRKKVSASTFGNYSHLLVF